MARRRRPAASAAPPPGSHYSPTSPKNPWGRWGCRDFQARRQGSRCARGGRPHPPTPLAIQIAWERGRIRSPAGRAVLVPPPRRLRRKAGEGASSAAWGRSKRRAPAPHPTSPRVFWGRCEHKRAEGAPRPSPGRRAGPASPAGAADVPDPCEKTRKPVPFRLTLARGGKSLHVKLAPARPVPEIRRVHKRAQSATDRQKWTGTTATKSTGVRSVCDSRGSSCCGGIYRGGLRQPARGRRAKCARRTFIRTVASLLLREMFGIMILP